MKSRKFNRIEAADVWGVSPLFIVLDGKFWVNPWTGETLAAKALSA